MDPSGRVAKRATELESRILTGMAEWVGRPRARVRWNGHSAATGRRKWRPHAHIRQDPSSCRRRGPACQREPESSRFVIWLPERNPLRTTILEPLPDRVLAHLELLLQARQRPVRPGQIKHSGDGTLGGTTASSDSLWKPPLPRIRCPQARGDAANRVNPTETSVDCLLSDRAVRVSEASPR